MLKVFIYYYLKRCFPLRSMCLLFSKWLIPEIVCNTMFSSKFFVLEWFTFYSQRQCHFQISAVFACVNWIQNTFLSTIQQQDSNHTPKGEFCDRMFTNCESIETYERNHTSVITAYKLWSQREGVRTVIDIGNCRQRCLYDVFYQIYQFAPP